MNVFMASPVLYKREIPELKVYLRRAQNLLFHLFVEFSHYILLTESDRGLPYTPICACRTDDLKKEVVYG